MLLKYVEFIPDEVYYLCCMLEQYPIGYKYIEFIDNRPDRVYIIRMNKIAEYIKASRKAAGLTQEEFAMRSGLGLRFVRDLEQGKQTARMDKVNQALAMFGMEAVPGRKNEP